MTKRLYILNLNTNYDIRALQYALENLPGLQSIDIFKATKTVVIDSEATDVQLLQAVTNIGFRVYLIKSFNIDLKKIMN